MTRALPPSTSFTIISIGILAHPLGCLSRLDFSTAKKVPMPKRAVFDRSRRGLSLDVSVDVHVLLVVEQSSLESQSKGCDKTPILTVPSTSASAARLEEKSPEDDIHTYGEL